MQNVQRMSALGLESTTSAGKSHSARRGFVAALLAALALVVFASIPAAAQISNGGTPPSFDRQLRSNSERLVMPPVDVQALLAEDAADESKALPFRFGAPFDVNYSLENSGTWEDLADGGRIWRITFSSPGAYSINLIYSRYRLPEGAQLFVYNSDRSHVIGAFTAKNNKPHGEMATQPVFGDEVTVEYYEPAAVVYEGELTISRVVHAYKDIFKTAKDALDFGGSGSCNNNVNCPEGANWQKEKRSVAMVLLSGGTRWCSGSMINNVRQDKTPYFLTANHCLGSSNTWIIMFNYESPNCSNINGPTFMTVQGTTQKAAYSTSDVGLLLLNEAPPDSYKVTFGGWNNLNTNGDSAVAIHHPAGDIKKISFDYDSYESTDYLGSTVNSSLSHWRIGVWEDGTTEGGSSGSPLYNKQHQVVGQLHGGWAACNDLRADYYGKFSLSWNGGGTPSTRVKDWLDPDNTGATSMNTWDPYAGVQIVHTPLNDTKDSVNAYPVVSTITADAALIANALLLKYTINFVPYLDTLVTTGNPNEYVGYIPAQSPGTEINYYLEAHAINGKADTTATYSFRVIDYAMLLTPSASSTSGAVDDTVFHNFTLTNDGLFNDSYNLSLTGVNWATGIYDNAGTSVISSTGTLAPNAIFNFKVRVIVPLSSYGQQDTSFVTAVSVAEPLVTKTSSVRTTSAGQPLTLPFVDTFPTTTLEVAKWVYNTGATIDGVGTSEPSALYSLRFNGSADTVMSQAIDMEVSEGVNFSYAYERTGGGSSPETGDDLIIEYFNDQGNWVELSRQFGSGADMTAYATVTIGAPLDAYHSAFRLRLRSVGASDDDWFVDDIGLDFGPEIAVNHASFDETVAIGDSTNEQLIISNSGLGGLNYSLVLLPDFSKRMQLFSDLAASGQVNPASVVMEQPLLPESKAQETSNQRGPEVVYDAGGPDNFGYYWVDSDQPGGPVYNWVDIEGTGTQVTGLADDNFVGPFPIGFSFAYYDSVYTQFYIASNGYIGFGPTTDYDGLTNGGLPSNATPNNAIYWCWDDLNILDTDNPGGKVLYQVVGSDLVIQFEKYPEYNSNAVVGNIITAQIILSPSGNIKIQYESAGANMDLLGCTIGMENKNGLDGLQVALNAAYIHAGLAVEFTKPAQWLYLSSLGGSVAPGTADTIDLLFSSADLDTGIYKSKINIYNNDPVPGNNPLVVPAKLTVTPPPPPYTCGDCDNSTVVNISDAVYLIAFVFSGGPAPNPLMSADADCSGGVSISDAVYLIAYVFSGGPSPCAACK
ncbi:MAG: trypsin-like peptidase domain-containing protein [bacterium]|nr:trypsin-like peptidase domain-containing protein [bacterium]